MGCESFEAEADKWGRRLDIAVLCITCAAGIALAAVLGWKYLGG